MGGRNCTTNQQAKVTTQQWCSRQTLITMHFWLRHALFENAEDCLKYLNSLTRTFWLIGRLWKTWNIPHTSFHFVFWPALCLHHLLCWLGPIQHHIHSLWRAYNDMLERFWKALHCMSGTWQKRHMMCISYWCRHTCSQVITCPFWAIPYED